MYKYKKILIKTNVHSVVPYIFFTLESPFQIESEYHYPTYLTFISFLFLFSFLIQIRKHRVMNTSHCEGCKEF